MAGMAIFYQPVISFLLLRPAACAGDKAAQSLATHSLSFEDNQTRAFDQQNRLQVFLRHIDGENSAIAEFKNESRVIFDFGVDPYIDDDLVNVRLNIAGLHIDIDRNFRRRAGLGEDSRGIRTSKDRPLMYCPLMTSIG